MTRLLAVCAILLAGCEDVGTASSPVDPQLAKLSEACTGGDEGACNDYWSLFDDLNPPRQTQVRQPVYTSPAPVYVPQPVLLQPFPEMRGPQRTVCRSQFGQQIVCTTN
jgi:hypothetical protein